ncbi:hypothetical protein FNV43_RR23643 [Rhamnella rubrinervis]|uniref:Pectinesterase inhibitor domain-containing protein n=1 Tax=Rhamnella rubrinervis TaxID=2594499 RepID=A0A8K0DTR5_9ROSA|nr:hypothetical protein FNV43_RR23643 [Rhamnella rubrinervis]
MEFNLCTVLLISFTSTLLLSPQALGDFQFPDLLPDLTGVTFNTDEPTPSARVPASAPNASPSAPAPAPAQNENNNENENEGGVSTLPFVRSAVKKICGVTENPALCSESIVPHMDGQVDPVSALKTEIQAALNLTVKATEQIKSLAQQESQSHMLKECLQVCIENYEVAQEDLKQAMVALDSHDMGLLRSVLSSVITDIGTCDDTFAEAPAIELPLKDELVKTLHELADNCMDISSLLN